MTRGMHTPSERAVVLQGHRRIRIGGCQSVPVPTLGEKLEGAESLAAGRRFG
jgi:hypothetical protein